MEIFECIKSRRSKRLFLDKEIPENLIKELLECAISAPSSRNCQPWHFVLVRDKNVKTQLAELKETGNDQHILTAPISIVVCVDINKSPARWIEDGVTAAENILLAAHNAGLGAVYVTGFSTADSKITKEIIKILNLPENLTPVSILPIGYPDPSEKIEEKALSDLNEITHYDKW